MSDRFFTVDKVWACDHCDGTRPGHAPSAEGKMNDGISYCYYGPNWWIGVTADNTFTGFGNAKHQPQLPFSDRIHISTSGRFDFSEKIQCLDMHVAWNRRSLGAFRSRFSTSDGRILTPKRVSGDVRVYDDTLAFEATSVEGGVVHFTDVNANSICFEDVGPEHGHWCVDIALIPNRPRPR